MVSISGRRTLRGSRKGHFSAVFVFMHKYKGVDLLNLWNVMKFQKTFDIPRKTRYNKCTFIREIETPRLSSMSKSKKGGKENEEAARSAAGSDHGPVPGCL